MDYFKDLLKTRKLNVINLSQSRNKIPAKEIYYTLNGTYNDS